MRIISSLIFSGILLLGTIKGNTQNCPTPGQNPATAFPVCGTALFIQNSVPICAGSFLPSPCPASDLLADKNPYWYSFTCYTAGSLGFLITPNNLNDDYDWQLFDVTGHNPNDVYTDVSLFVACNWSGSTGITGASAGGTGLINCGSNYPIFSRMPLLIAGHNYLLLISHYTNSQSGYQLNFTGGTASITDPLLPLIQNASADCGGTQVTVRFNKKLSCNTLIPNGSDFSISGALPAITITGASGFGCTGFDFDSALVSLSAPLGPGNYSILIATGTDANTLLDNCGNAIAAGNSASFTVEPQIPLPMGTVNTPACAPNSITLTFTDLIKCNSIAANGSDFIITGPSSVTVSTAAGVSCNANGETNTITLQLTSPIIVGGLYQVTMATGTDGNTLTGGLCNRQVATGDAASFTITQQAPVPMGTVAPPPCIPSSVTITFAEPVKCNSIAADGSDFIITGPSAVTVTTATAVACDANGETTSITIQLAAPILVTGTYQLQITTGTDGNTIVGNCSRQVTVGSATSFILAAQAPVTMGTVTPPACIPQTITLTFTDPIKCNSIAANGSDFIITGASVVSVSSATAVSCDANGETTSIAIQFAAPILITGNYQAKVVTGSDGNTLVSLCGRQVTAGSATPFTVAPQPAVAMGTVNPPVCIPQAITLTFTDPIKCNSIAADGSDFIITGSAPVIITAAAPVSCDANGETTSITIQFAAPILITGNYQVQAVTGSDGNTLISGPCGRQVTVGASTSFALTAQPPITMGTVPAVSCSPSSVTLNFTDNILCSSIAANGSDFIISGPAPVTIVAATSVCNTNGETNAITLQFSGPVTVSGNFQIKMVTGSDGNTLIGNCNRRTTVGDIAPFVIPVALPVAMDSLVPVACSPSSLKLLFAASIKCSSIAANGSDFIVTGGASAVTVTSATAVCDANGLTNSITIQLASPVVAGDTYQLQLVTGSDGNTLLSDCNRPTPTSSLPFTVKDTVSAVFQYQIKYDCLTDAITFSHDGQHDVNQWAWRVNGTAAGSLQTFTKSFSALSQNQIQLVVSNGFCSNTYSTSINLDNKVTVDFSLADIVCPMDTVLFVNKSTGVVDNWLWIFGNSNTSSLQTPLAQIYPLTGIEKIYTVSLSAINNNGCRAITTHSIKVLSSCIIAVPSAFTPNNDGLNDYLYPLNALKAENLDFKVFNRWGQLVFHSTDWTKKWDGRINGIMQTTAVYLWTLNFTYKDTKQKYSMRGISTLIR